jgi:hypothetical protein
LRKHIVGVAVEDGGLLEGQGLAAPGLLADLGGVDLCELFIQASSDFLPFSRKRFGNGGGRRDEPHAIEARLLWRFERSIVDACNYGDEATFHEDGLNLAIRPEIPVSF